MYELIIFHYRLVPQLRLTRSARSSPTCHRVKAPGQVISSLQSRIETNKQPLALAFTPTDNLE